MIFRTEPDRFGQKIKERNTGDRARREAENKMQLIPESERKRTADKRSDKRSASDEKNRHARVRDYFNNASIAVWKFV
jgi:hypothetical protein